MLECGTDKWISKGVSHTLVCDTIFLSVPEFGYILICTITVEYLNNTATLMSQVH